MSKTTTKRSTLSDVVTREYTIHLHKLVHGRSFKKRTPTAVKAVKAFAQKAMGTEDVRIDPALNKALWARGIRNVPRRIRVRIARKRNDDEDAKHKLYSYVSYVPVTSFKGMLLFFLPGFDYFLAPLLFVIRRPVVIDFWRLKTREVGERDPPMGGLFSYLWSVSKTLLFTNTFCCPSYIGLETTVVDDE